MGQSGRQQLNSLLLKASKRLLNLLSTKELLMVTVAVQAASQRSPAGACGSLALAVEASFSFSRKTRSKRRRSRHCSASTGGGIGV